MKVTAVAGNKVGHDLATSIRQTFVATGKALQDHVDVLRAVIFKDQVMPGLELAHVSHSLFKYLPVLIGQPSAILKLENEWGGHGHRPSPEGDLSRLTHDVAMRYE